MKMVPMKIKSVGSFIDDTIEDVNLRIFDWHIAVYTDSNQMGQVLLAKWNRAAYLQNT